MGVLTEQLGVRADKAIVVQGLHNSHAMPLGGLIGRWRDQWECVRAMHNSRPLAGNQRVQRLLTFTAPERIAKRLTLTHRADFVVVTLKADNLMTAGFQEVGFSFEYAVLTARLLVPVMTKKHLHPFRQEAQMTSKALTEARGN